MTISGLSSSGNRYETNAGMITLTVIDETAVEPPSGAPTPSSGSGTVATPVPTAAGGLGTLDYPASDESDVDTGNSQEDSLNQVFDTAVLVEGETQE